MNLLSRKHRKVLTELRDARRALGQIRGQDETEEYLAANMRVISAEAQLPWLLRLDLPIRWVWRA